MRQVVVIGSDHAGFKTKERIKKELAGTYTLIDVGDFSEESNDDYPRFAAEVAKAVSDDPKRTKGILICGSGTGMVIAANKFKGVRAAFAFDAYSAKMARHDNDANILALRGRKFAQKDAANLAKIFLKTQFSGLPRHKRRIKAIGDLER